MEKKGIDVEKSEEKGRERSKIGRKSVKLLVLFYIKSTGMPATGGVFPGHFHNHHAILANGH